LLVPQPKSWGAVFPGPYDCCAHALHNSVGGRDSLLPAVQMPLHTDLTVELFVAAKITSLRITESPSHYGHRFNRQDDEDLPPDDVIDIAGNSVVHCKSTLSAVAYNCRI